MVNKIIIIIFSKIDVATRTLIILSIKHYHLILLTEIIKSYFSSEFFTTTPLLRLCLVQDKINNKPTGNKHFGLAMGNKDEKETPDKKRRKTSITTTDVAVKTKEDIYTVSGKPISKYVVLPELLL